MRVCGLLSVALTIDEETDDRREGILVGLLLIIKVTKLGCQLSVGVSV